MAYLLQFFGLSDLLQLFYLQQSSLMVRVRSSRAFVPCSWMP